MATVGISPSNRLHVAVTTADSAILLNVAAGSAANTNVKTMRILMTGQSSSFSSQAELRSGHQTRGSSRNTHLAFALRNQTTTTVDEVLRITTEGHLASSGAAPAASSCGSGPSVVATATDSAGNVTIGTGSTTSCTLTFNVTYATAPACTVAGDNTAVTYAATTTATTLVITSSADMASDVINYICIGHT